MKKFDNIFIITYGRSGSTLLSGLLNSLDGYTIRGENYNLLIPLFNSYRRINDAITKHGGPQADLTTDPWWGVNEIDPDLYIADLRRMIDNVLIGKLSAPPRVYGFKEIRYPWVIDILPEFISFIRKIYPNTGLIFNYRDLDKVMQSGFWALETDENRRNIRNQISLFEEASRQYAAENREYCFQIRYEDMVDRTGVLKLLFDFLGEYYDEAKVEQVLSVKHSYGNAKQESVL
jgi:hypothetical protein